ncbi:MAG: hypothetical protein ACYTG0_22370 [Planctomycetota bacterium]
METSGLEPPTPGLQSGGPPNVSDDTKALTETATDACTAACTSEPENARAGTPDADRSAGDRQQGEGSDQADPLAKLAAALLTLSPADRERLAAMLKGA